MTKTKIKICGIKEPETLNAACTSGADFIGFVFYPTSPRNISKEIAWTLAQQVPTGVRSVGLFVNPTDAELDDITNTVPLDMIQLHGNESPQRVTDIKLRTNMPVIKAIGIANEDDIETAKSYEHIVDWLLFDYKSPEHGGTGKSFDWSLLKEHDFEKPVMLSGGLTVDNVAEAIKAVQLDAIDVSSGVESKRGVKDAEKIKRFVKAAQSE